LSVRDHSQSCRRWRACPPATDRVRYRGRHRCLSRWPDSDCGRPTAWGMQHPWPA